MEPQINNTIKVSIAIIVLLACAYGVVWINLYGKAENGLHQTTLSWCFTLIGGILIALGFTALRDAISSIIAKK
jgi:hypothetical protein